MALLAIIIIAMIIIAVDAIAFFPLLAQIVVQILLGLVAAFRAVIAAKG